jgi:hypothetical protein
MGAACRTAYAPFVARHEGAAPDPLVSSTCRGTRALSIAWRRTAWRQ